MEENDLMLMISMIIDSNSEKYKEIEPELTKRLKNENILNIILAKNRDKSFSLDIEEQSTFIIIINRIENGLFSYYTINNENINQLKNNQIRYLSAFQNNTNSIDFDLKEYNSDINLKNEINLIKNNNDVFSKKLIKISVKILKFYEIISNSSAEKINNNFNIFYDYFTNYYSLRNHKEFNKKMFISLLNELFYKILKNVNLCIKSDKLYDIKPEKKYYLKDSLELFYKFQKLNNNLFNIDLKELDFKINSIINLLEEFVNFNKIIEEIKLINENDEYINDKLQNFITEISVYCYDINKVKNSFLNSDLVEYIIFESKIKLKSKYDSNKNIETLELFNKYFFIINNEFFSIYYEEEIKIYNDILDLMIKDINNSLNTNTDSNFKNLEVLYYTKIKVNKILNNFFLEKKLKDIFNDLKIKVEEKFTQVSELYLREVEDFIDEMDLAFNEKLFERDFESNTIKLNFPSKIIKYNKEINIFKEMGFNLLLKNNNIMNYFASKNYIFKNYYKIKQIADSYTYWDSINIRHQSLLLNEIEEFENLLKEYETLIIEKDKLDEFIKKAFNLIDIIKKENNDLIEYEELMIKILKDLLNINIIKDENVLIDKIFSIKLKLDLLTNNKDKRLGLIFQNYVCSQLSKILIFLLQNVFNNIENYIPQIDIFVKVNLYGNKLILKPNVNEIKIKIFDIINNTINLPNKIKFVDNWKIFIPSITNSTSKNIHKSYFWVDKSIIELEKGLIEIWNCSNLMEKIDNKNENNIDSILKYEQIILDLRNQKKEISQMKDSIQIGCFNVILSNIKANIDKKLGNLLNKISKNIKDIYNEISKDILEFITQINNKLDNNLDSVEKLNELFNNYNEIMEKRNICNNKIKYLEISEKNLKILGHYNNLLKEENILDKWDKLNNRLNNFDKELENKKEEMKSNIDTRVITMKNELERFYKKYISTKISDLKVENRFEIKNYIILFHKQKLDFDSLNNNINNLLKDVKHFNIKAPKFPYLEEMNIDFVVEWPYWNLYFDFENEIENLNNIKWRYFGKNLYKFIDIITNYNNKIVIDSKIKITWYFKKLLEFFLEITPILKFMKGDTFESEHWILLLNLLNLSKNFNIETLYFGDLINISNSILSNKLQIKELNEKAIGERGISEALDEIYTWSQDSKYSFINSNTSNNSCKIIAEWTEMMSKVSDNITIIQSIKDSKYYKKFEIKLSNIELNFNDLDKKLSDLNLIQRKWLYLEPIFARNNLGKENELFKEIDKKFRNIMDYLFDKNVIISLNNYTNIVNELSEIINKLDFVQKGLYDFLEVKRNKFPRFYFIGDDDLLEILGHSHEPEILQNHLKKLFNGINSLIIDKINNKNFIIGIKSLEGEEIDFLNKISFEEEIITIMSKIELEMVNSLKRLIIECLKGENRFNFSKFPAQIVILAQQIYFTNSLDLNINISIKDIISNTEQILKKLIENKTKANKNDILKIKPLILEIIHQKDILKNIKEKGGFYWIYQLKYKLNKDDKLVYIFMNKAKFQYSYEYLGNYPKLVHTPLTDKCYLTLTQGLLMGFGGNPYGPAGTGKTETVKALSQELGRQILVFNCDENLDYKSMGRIFIGLVKCGAWGCFDEFNRLLELQLSAISQQIQVIQNAIKEKEKTINLMGNEIQVNFNAGIFVTLNPANKNYGGRSKLPENLKQLFRPVSMTRPDDKIISEVLLLSEGFLNANILSQKIINLMEFSKKSLSNQKHYDWGLRHLKTILNTAGSYLDKNKNLEPENIIIQAIKTTTISKLTNNDITIFNFLIDKIFNIEKSGENISNKELLKNIKEVYKSKNLIENSEQIEKILQFNEAIEQRIGVVIVGEQGSSKSTIWKILYEALKKNENINLHILNPKAISKTKLLGYMNPDTREFHEGILTYAARKVIKTNEKSWIICDGEIDPEWIEALNSVLDDNRLMTLPTGERIKFHNKVNFIFESCNLNYASPATITRMGVIYLSANNISENNILQCILGEEKKEETQSLDNLLKKNKDNCFDGFKSLLKNIKTNFNINNEKLLFLIFSYIFIPNFNKYIRNDIEEELSLIFKEKIGLNFTYNEDNNEIISHELDDSEDFCNNFTYFNSLTKLCEFYINNGISFAINGEKASGKDLLIKTVYKSLSLKNNYSLIEISCNSFTNTNEVIFKLENECVVLKQGRKLILKPKENGKLIFLIKNLNVVKPDKYKHVQLVEFFTQLLEYKGYYNNELEFCEINKDIILIFSSISSNNIGRYKLSSKYLSNIIKINLDSYNDEDIGQIISFQINKKFSKNNNILNTYFMNLYSEINEELKNLKKSQNNYSFKSIIKIIENLDNSNINITMKSLCYLFISSQFKDEAKEKINSIIENNLKNNWNIDNDDLLVTNFLNKGKTIESITIENYVKYCQNSITLYEREHFDFEFFINKDNIYVINMLDLAISSNSSSIILLGYIGSQRRSCLKLSAFNLDYNLINLNITLNYSMREFNKEMKKIIEDCYNISNKQILLVEDYELIDKSMLKSLSYLISNGEIIGLFKKEEIDQLININKDEINDLFPNLSSNEQFKKYIKYKLKIVLFLEISNNNYEEILIDNPGILNNSLVLNINNPNEDFNIQFFKYKLSKSIICQKVKLNFEELSSNLNILHHNFSKQNLSYYHFCELFLNLLEKKKIELDKNIEKYRKGLDKILQSEEKIIKLEEVANNQRKEVSNKQIEADNALKEINKTFKEASNSKEESEKIKKILEVDESKTIESKKEIEKSLDKVKPLVESAKKEVSSISKADLSELKQYSNPHKIILDILTGLLMMFGNKNINWINIKKFFNQSGILDSICNLNIKTISRTKRDEVKSYINSHTSSFNKENAYNVSKAVGPIAEFIKANIQLGEVYDNISPLELKMEAVENKLMRNKEKLYNCEKELNEIDNKVKILEKEFTLKTSEAKVLSIKLENIEQRLFKAKTLNEKLSNEKVRWKEIIENLNIDLSNIVNRVLISSYYINYLSNLSEENRIKYLKNIIEMLGETEYNFINYMSNEMNLLNMKKLGINDDLLSLENGIILESSIKYPLLIDPSINLTKWISNYYKSIWKNEQVIEIDFRSSKLTFNLELSCRFGKIIIIKNFEELKPIFSNLLKKDIKTNSGRSLILVGDKLIDFNKNFNIILSSPSSNLKLNQLSNYLTIINNELTYKGLESQLLSYIINHELPDLEEEKNKLIKNEQNAKIDLISIENKILDELSSSNKDLLDNEPLLNSLNSTKTKNDEIKNLLNNFKGIKDTINQKRNYYIQLANKGTNIYLTLKKLNSINFFYSYSLNFYLNIFLKNLKDNKNIQDNNKIEILIFNLYKLIFNKIGYSIFNEDLIIFGLLLSKSFKDDLYNELEMNFILGRLSYKKLIKSNKFIKEESLENYSILVENFPSLVKKLDFNEEGWEYWVKCSNPEKEFYLIKNKNFSDFEKIMIIKLLRPNRLINCIIDVVQNILKIKNISISPNIKNIYNLDSSKDRPILIITKMGSDPSKEIQEFNVLNSNKGGLVEISMGGDKLDFIYESIKECKANGKWLLLKNIHLVPDLIHNIYIEFKEKIGESSDNFRLWLTTEETKSLPIDFIENSLKIIFENPPGLKKNIEKIYTNIKYNDIDKFDDKNSKVLFSLSYLNSILIERKKYIPQGWTKKYEFGIGDFKASMMMLDIMTNGKKSLDWEVMKNILEKAIYGGRIDNEYDLYTLKAYLNLYINKNILEKNKIFNNVGLPLENKINSHIQNINLLKDKDNASDFGLDNSSELIINTNKQVDIIRKIKLTEIINIENESLDILKGKFNNILKIWNTIRNYKKINDFNINLKKNWSNLKDSFDNFIIKEIKEMIKIFETIDKDFNIIEDIINNNKEFNQEYKELFNNIISEIVPLKWDRILEISDDLIIWMNRFSFKFNNIFNWTSFVNNFDKFINSSVNLNDIISLDLFYSSIQLKTSQDFGFNLDDLEIKYTFKKINLDKTYIIDLKGILLSGALFKNNILTLKDNDSSSIDYQNIDNVYFYFEKKSKKENLFPLYLDSSRQKIVSHINIDYERNIENYRLSGAAFILLK